MKIFLYSVAGFGALAQCLFQILIILLALFLIHIAYNKKGFVRKISLSILLIIIGFYVYFLTTKGNWKKDIEISYVGKYHLTQYKNCNNCFLELRRDNSYNVFDSIRVYENGEWNYFDDGDISYIEFNNGGQLGGGKYAYDKEIK